MKYKDFKTMTSNEMKNIIGGDVPVERETCGTCPSSTQGGGQLTCYKEPFIGCIKPSNCNNAVDCKTAE